MVVEIIQSDLAPGDDLGSGCQVLHFFEIGFSSELRFMWMNSNRRINKFVLFGKLDGTVKRPRAGSAANGENGFNPRILGALQHGWSVRIKLLHLKMRVRIDEDGSLVVGHWSCDDGRLARPRMFPGWPVDLLQSRPHRHIFEEAGQYGLPTLRRRGHNHSIRFQSAKFSRREVRYDDNFSSDQELR